ncbi:MAG: hypothetical protein QXT63_09285, partial [Thermoplasmata archaeon]
VNVGMTGLDGSITAYDFEIGWHYVTAQRLMLSAYGEFYSEGSGNENPYDEYFYLCEGRAVALDDDLMLNDIAIEIDVDIPGGEGNVTTVAKLYDSSDELIDMKSHTYYAIGYNYDEEYINFSNLNWEEYHLKYELFDEDGNLEDTREQTITLLKSYGYVNVEHLITDEQGDTNLNDVIFYAHLKNEVIEDVVIKIYNENGELCATVETDASGIAEKMNLAVGEYNWEAFAENGTKIEEGAFRILQRTVTGTAQVGTFSYLTDYDGDSYHDDFVLQAYNAAGNSVNYINVAVYDMASYLIDDGLTVNGEYVLENIAEGWYSFVCTNQLTGRRIATGIFYSYGQINENARININAYVFADDGMWLNDVTLKVTNATGAPVRNAQVLLNNNYLGMTDIDGEITTYDLAQGWYKADAYYLTGHAYCRFYSEGEGFEEYFYSAEIKGGIADGDGIRNDIITKFDVDIDGGSDTVKVVAEAYYDSNGSLAKSAQISYLTSGSDWDEVYLNITNLSYEVYDVTLTLYDSHGNYMDTYSQEDVSLYNYGTEINVDTYVFEWDYDGLVNDILFTAHIAGEPVEGVLIELYHQNGLMVSSAITNEHGEAYFPDLTNDTYYFESMMNGNITEKGWIVIRSLSEMARSAVLTDYDYDNYYDDFKFECYNTTSGYPADFRIEITKPDGSVMSEFSSGVFILEDLPRWNYSYKVYLYVNSNEILFENCTFFSYGTPYKIYVKAETFDEDGDTYKDDVKIHAYDSLGVNASGGELYIDNVYVGNLDINGNYTGYNFAYGNHIVKVYYNGSTGYTTFFSMGDGTQSAFWNIIVYLDGDNNLESAGVDDISEMEAIGSINGVNILVLFDKWSNGDTRAYYVKPGSSTYIPISSINPAWGNELNMGDPATLVTFVNWVNDNYPA